VRFNICNLHLNLRQLVADETVIHPLISVSNTFLHDPLINYAAGEYPCSTTSSTHRYHLENTPIKDGVPVHNRSRNAPLLGLSGSQMAMVGQSLSLITCIIIRITKPTHNRVPNIAINSAISRLAISHSPYTHNLFFNVRL